MPSDGPSYSCCFLCADCLTVFLGSHVKQFNTQSGRLLADVPCDSTIWGPPVRTDSHVLFSTSGGSIYSFDLANAVCRHLGKSLSNFYSAALVDKSLVVLVSGSVHPKYLPFVRKTIARVEVLDLASGARRELLDLGYNAAFKSISGAGSVLLVARSNTVSRMDLSGNVLWSTAIGGPRRDYVSVGFHGEWSGGTLVSAGPWIALLDVQRGQIRWEYRADEIADIVPLENGRLLFSTCGGGFLGGSFGVENGVGVLNPQSGAVSSLISVCDTRRVALRRLDGRIVASAVVPLSSPVPPSSPDEICYASQFREFQARG